VFLDAGADLASEQFVDTVESLAHGREGSLDYTLNPCRRMVHR
jgi:hypothetical protein